MLFPGRPRHAARGNQRPPGRLRPARGTGLGCRGQRPHCGPHLYGILYDLPDMQFFDRFGIGPPWGSTITIFNPPGGFTNPYQGYPGGAPFRYPFRLQPMYFFPPGRTIRRLCLCTSIRLTCSSGISLSSTRSGKDWLLSASYLGNKSTHRWITQQS